MGVRSKLFWIFLLFFSSTGWAADSSLPEYFDCEGNPPFTREGPLFFSALQSRYLSPNGHGWRNELKKKAPLRKSMYETRESLSAKVTFRLSSGAKTVFVQYHEAGTGTLLMMFIGDIQNKALLNGIACDGIFDIYCRVTQEDGRSITLPLCTGHSGDTFPYRMENKNGEVTITLNEKTVSIRTKDAPMVYLKFGDYLQAQDPYTGKQHTQSDFETFYAGSHITEDEILFEDLVFQNSLPAIGSSVKFDISVPNR